MFYEQPERAFDIDNADVLTKISNTANDLKGANPGLRVGLLVYNNAHYNRGKGKVKLKINNHG